MFAPRENQPANVLTKPDDITPKPTTPSNPARTPEVAVPPGEAEKPADYRKPKPRRVQPPDPRRQRPVPARPSRPELTMDSFAPVSEATYASLTVEQRYIMITLMNNPSYVARLWHHPTQGMVMGAGILCDTSPETDTIPLYEATFKALRDLGLIVKRGTGLSGNGKLTYEDWGPQLRDTES